ncbi:MAG: hypothetical protein F6J87_27465 [Spirulina sp. SIO3F2]|nr:hypothetical protein [Spirulina sp. SIO3F2]
MQKPTSPLQRLLWGTLLLINSTLLLLYIGSIIVPTFYSDSLLGQWFETVQWEDLPLSEEQTVALVFTIAIVYLLLKNAHHAVVERDRRKLYQQWAEQHHWLYDPQKDQALYRKYRFLLGIPGYYASSSPNTDICAVHRFQRRWRNYIAVAYTHYVRTRKVSSSGKSRRTTVTHSYLGVTLIHTQSNFPKLYISPTHWSDPIFAFISQLFELVFCHLGFNFSEPSWQEFIQPLNHSSNGKQHIKKYQVETGNPDFIQQFFHPKMLKYLSTLPRGLRFEIDRDILVIYQEGRLNLDTIQVNLNHLHRIYQLIPERWK